MNTINNPIQKQSRSHPPPNEGKCIERLFLDAEKIRAGLRRHGPALGLECFESRVQELLDAARVAEGAYDISAAAERAAARIRAEADYLALRFILATGDLGRREGVGTQEAHVKPGRPPAAAVPEIAMEKTVVLAHLADVLETCSRERPAPLLKKAGSFARSLQQRLTRAFKVYSTARRRRQEWEAAQQRTAKALRVNLESVLCVLGRVLRPWDDRWTDFGIPPTGALPPEETVIYPSLAHYERAADGPQSDTQKARCAS